MSATAVRPPEEHATRRTPPGGWLLGGFVALLLAAAIGAALLRDTAPPDPGSPEAAVQGYLQAVFDHEPATARTYFSEDLSRRCPPAAFRHVGVPDSPTAALADVAVTGDTAVVSVRIRSLPQPFPPGGGDVFVEEFGLRREHGTWRIADVPWPLGTFDCGS